MRRAKFLADQFELPGMDSPAGGSLRQRPELPARGSWIRISGAGKANGAYRVRSALGYPGGMFLGLEMDRAARAVRAARREPRSTRAALTQELLYLQ